MELTRKMFAGETIDPDEIKENLSMFLFFVAKDLEYRKATFVSPSELLKIAQEAVTIYEIFVKKNIRDFKYKQTLLSYNAIFQMVINLSKLAANQIYICDPVLNNIKILIEEAYKSRLVAYLLHLVLPIASQVVFRSFPDITHALQMIAIDCVKRTVFLNPSADQEMYFLNSKLNFLSYLLQNMTVSLEGTSKQQSFDDLLTKLNVEVIYPPLTEAFGSKENAQMIANYLLYTVNEFELVCEKYAGHFPIDLSKENISFWRGLAFQELSYNEKLPQKRMDLVLKSMDHWLSLLNSWPGIEDLVALKKCENCSAMIIFLCVSDRNILNYEYIIEMKCNALASIDKSNVKLAIIEINQLRHDLIMMIKFFLNFQKLRPDMFKTELLRRLYLTIAEHYRSLILDDKIKQEFNLDDLSISYIRKHIAVDSKTASTEKKIINMIDRSPFIRMYRS